MKNKMTVTAFLILFLSVSQAEAQFFKKLREKAEKKIERRLERKADEKADQALDSVFEKKSKKRRKSERGNTDETSTEKMDTGGFDLGGLMDAVMNQEEAKYESDYTFFLTTEMEIVSNREKPMMITTSYGDGSQFIQMENDMFMINDFTNGSMITLNNEKKEGTIINTKLMEIMQEMGEDPTEEENTEVTIKATGKTKTVNGYRCKNYLVTSEDMDMDIWATKDIDFDMKQYAEKMAELFKNPSSAAMMKQDVGFPMQMTSTIGKDTVEMTILKVTEASTSIDLSEYTITKM